MIIIFAVKRVETKITKIIKSFKIKIFFKSIYILIKN
jgi:hypothetical protein